MEYSYHNELVFTGNLNDLWFGMEGMNESGMRLPKYSVVRLSGGTVSQMTFNVDAAPNATNQLKVIGVAATTIDFDVNENTYGFIAFGGFVETLPVYGTVVMDSWLKMSDSGGLPGYAEAYTTVSKGRIFAKAKSANASGHGTVKALVFPWRL